MPENGCTNINALVLISLPFEFFLFVSRKNINILCYIVCGTQQMYIFIVSERYDDDDLFKWKFYAFKWLASEQVFFELYNA